MNHDTAIHAEHRVEVQQPPPAQRSSWTWIIVVIIVIVIIAVVIFFFYERGPDVVGTLTHTWTVITNTTSGPVSFTADAGVAWINSATGNVQLGLVAPANPTGKEFIINNVQGGGTVTIGSGITVFGGGTVIQIGRSVAFIWLSATQLTPIIN